MIKILTKEVILYDGRKMLQLSEDNGISKELRTVGQHELVTRDAFKEILKPGMQILDIGANIGYYALLEAELVGDTGFVWAIEPVHENVACLNASIKKYGITNIKVVQLAMGSKNGSVPMFTSFYSSAGTMVKEKDMSPSYRSEWKGDNEGDGWKFKEEIIVDQMRVDDFRELYDVPVPNIVRMDTEGYEVDIFAGAQKTLEEMPKGSFLFVEFHPLIYASREAEIALASNLYQHGFVAVWPRRRTLEEIIDFFSTSEYAIHLFLEKE